ncbi:MAG: GerAB/ArcD/ProY family transporter, partial [Clostridia bacterium]|nr:GerAB/ArcD/ProY family transporter [Clostridia bacterium]
MKINYHQLSIMLFMSFISLKFLVLPSALYLHSANMSWLVVLVLMVLDGIYAILTINLMKKNQNNNINEFMNETLGPVLTKIIFAILAIQFFLQMSNIAKGLEFFVIENFYNNYSWLLFSLPLVALTGFMIYKGIRNIARVQEMFYLSIIVGCIYVALKSLGDVDPLVYLPMFKDGFIPLVNSGYQHMNWFGSFTFLIMLFGKVDFSSKKKNTSTFYIIFAILLVQLLYFVFYGLFDMTSPTHTFAISDISQFSSSKSFIDELSWLVVSLWVVIQSIQIALYGYCLVIALMYLFHIKSKIVVIT